MRFTKPTRRASGGGFNHRYLISPRFAALHNENLLVLDEMHPETVAFLDAARDILRRHFRERREELTSELVQQWHDDGVYPYDGDPADKADRAARKRFDGCARAIRAYSDNFDTMTVVEKKLLFRLLRETLEANPDGTTLIADLLGVPPKRRRELQKL